MQCPACATDLPEEDLFCESCGVSLKAAPAAPVAAAAACNCGAAAGETDEEGYCLRCGRRVRRPASDHIEESVSPLFAAVSDRGLKHDRNEDRFSILQAGAAFVMVVCDGVSATRRSEVASAAVAEGVAASLAKELRDGGLRVGTGTASEAAMRRAIAAGVANLSAQIGANDGENPPSTTVVAALVTGSEIVIGWIGDSRAYWIDTSGATMLTRDHSWINDVTAAGEMTVEEAEASPRAHAITRWIGADAGTNPYAEPDSEIVRRAIPGPGTLLLCTDGLWNYARKEAEIATLVGGFTQNRAGEEAIATARRLVQFANQHGGQDNITAAVLRVSDKRTTEGPGID